MAINMREMWKHVEGAFQATQQAAGKMAGAVSDVAKNNPSTAPTGAGDAKAVAKRLYDEEMAKWSGKIAKADEILGAKIDAPKLAPLIGYYKSVRGLADQWVKTGDYTSARKVLSTKTGPAADALVKGAGQLEPKAPPANQDPATGSVTVSVFWGAGETRLLAKRVTSVEIGGKRVDASPGRVTIEGLPPGDYVAGASADDENGFHCRGASTEVTIEAGATAKAEIHLVPTKTELEVTAGGIETLTVTHPIPTFTFITTGPGRNRRDPTPLFDANRVTVRMQTRDELAAMVNERKAEVRSQHSSDPNVWVEFEEGPEDYKWLDDSIWPAGGNKLQQQLQDKGSTVLKWRVVRRPF